MFKDRQVLVEKEIIGQKRACGQLYLRMITGKTCMWIVTCMRS